MQTIKHNQRRRSLTALVTLAILFAPLFPVTALAEARSAQAQRQRPNIVVIMTDDQETSSLLHMPKLHRLIAEEGITFNSFVNLPLCAPSRASFLTGQAAHNHGIKSE